jgi:uncharacterized protein involved in exopolysaccharide biosynthesis
MTSSTDGKASGVAPIHDDVSLSELTDILLKQKKFIATTTFAVAISSALISLLLPDVYTATAKVLPPQQSHSTASVLANQLSGLAGLVGGSVGIKNPADIYVGMLKSRTIADALIGKYRLREIYDTDTMVATRMEFAANSRITTGKDGLIAIEFDDTDPERSAAIANGYVEELDKLAQSLAVTEAAQRRLFFERQLQLAKQELTQAEAALKATQEKTGLIKLDDQGRAAIEAIAALRAQISAKEVELQAMRTFTTGSNPDYVRAREQLIGLKGELAKLERDQLAGGGGGVLPFSKIPEAGLEYVRRYRDVKYQESIFEFLAKQLEAARIDEAKEAAVIQVVDEAIPPDRKSRPKRTLIVLVSTALALLLACFYTIAVENHRRRRARDTLL